jgi:signal transduction histidine kinase
VLRTGEIIYVEDRAAEEPQTFDGAPTGYGSDAWAIVPLLHDGESLGSIALGFGSARSFSSEDRVLVEALATQCAQAMERARLLESERAARRDAESANLAKSELLAKVSHETRQPVHATVGWTETLAMEIQGPVTEGQREALRRIKQNQSRLLAVLNDLLDMSRIEAGKLELRITDVMVAQVIDAVDSAVAPQMRARDIRYDFCRPPETLVMRADHGQLLGILTNLLSNAAKFTPPGGQVSVDCRREGGRVVVAVCDTGIGITPELHERVFEPFFQVDAGFTRTTTGTGLGLAISREAARAMGGELTLSSAPGDGSIFSIWLPAAH